MHPFFEFPKHLYHETKPPIVANDAGTEAAARKDGYGDTYIPQEYPKHINGRLVNNVEEEAALAKESE